MKNVLITGCSSGLGRALAIEFARQGWQVWATGRKKETLSDLVPLGIKAEELDVTSEKQVCQLISQVAAEGGIDVLVNNAGYGAMGATVEMPETEVRMQFETNVFAPLKLVQAVAPAMIERRSGTIINIGSISGQVVTPFSGTYCASKAAFNSFSDALRIELKPFGIDVMSVKPGAIRSRFAENAKQALARALPENSFYKPVEKALWKRANASQDRPTSAEHVARVIVSRVKAGKASGSLKLGNGSRSLPFLQWLLPESVFEWVLSRVFQLNHLK
ncbi:short-chain dehydrogenase [Endozoicomonas montiporae]|uniref:Short-chain dehydrogenase n=2 Tax=Endozoicomonas montiporae TaxID=1027273 RepID=A0A081MYW1_9GAMM|nr:SDR family NAD(P)-dependent oxidoreductase [Endozoicomonas montiporae]AMO54849.1 putative oxidoreductase [Endozoicomonas montiporae CL-33]KEQ11384.1 short-chain dehydrogenase [Endozoicomonas montiporae]